MKYGFERVSVVGLGYIGLPTAATIASRSVDVVGVDVNEDVVRLINEGQAHFSEPDLDIVLQSTNATGKLRAVTVPEPADAFLIAVPTPVMDDNRADLRYVEAAGRSIAPVLKPGDLVILESTSPVGTTRKLRDWIAEERPDLRLPHDDRQESDLHVAYCPERILPGQMLFELVRNDRIIGGLTARCTARARALYEIFVQGTLYETSSGTAELVKLLENAYRDVNIAFANEVSVLCDRLGLDAWEAISLANRHPRVNILNPGPGVGGHCIAVDPWFLISAAPPLTQLMRAARDTNNAKPHFVLEKIRSRMQHFSDPVVACLGLSYKPDVDDIRESPAIEIVSHLAREGTGKVLVVEPHLDALPAVLADYANVEMATLDDALDRADVIALLVAHKKFSTVSHEKISNLDIVDSVGLWRQAAGSGRAG